MHTLIVTVLVAYPYQLDTPETIRQRAAEATRQGYLLRSFAVERLDFKEHVKRLLLEGDYDALEDAVRRILVPRPVACNAPAAGEPDRGVRKSEGPLLLS